MSINWERATHPDLLEEEQAARAAAVEAPPAPPERGARGRRASRPAAAPATDSPSDAAPGADAVGEDVTASPSEPTAEAPAASPQEGEAKPTPEWLEQVRTASDPQDMLATLLKNVPIEELKRHPQISGWIGVQAQRHAREQSLQQQVEEASRQKREAWQKGDYYRLGELAAPELEVQALQAQQQEAAQPYMQNVAEFQQTLPVEVQQRIGGRNYASFKDYLAETVAAARQHDIDQAVAAELKKRAPAVHKAELSATVGAEPSPERDGGPAPGVREITDAEVGSMSLEEYDKYFDTNGHPRNGVRVRYTRAVDVSRR